METTFRLAPHSNGADRVIEVWRGDVMIAAVYVAEDGVRVISKHELRAEHDPTPPNAITVTVDVG